MKRDNRFTGIIIVILLLCFFIILGLSLAMEQTDSDMPSLILRVVPNSDLPYDQDLKLKVRDDLIMYLNRKLDPTAPIRSQTEKLLPDINEVVAKRLETEQAELTFTTVIMDDVNVPGGIKLEITLGEGQGSNFWCVIFPNMCFVPEEVKPENTVQATEPGIQPVNDHKTEEKDPIRIKWFYFEQWKQSRAYKFWEQLWLAKMP
jgi:stage II sporulation protein R